MMNLEIFSYSLVQLSIPLQPFLEIPDTPLQEHGNRIPQTTLCQKIGCDLVQSTESSTEKKEPRRGPIVLLIDPR